MLTGHCILVKTHSLALSMEIISYRQRPSDGVLDPPGRVLGGVDLPELLEADPVDLALVPRVQVELFHQVFGQLTSEKRIEGRK